MQPQGGALPIISDSRLKPFNFEMSYVNLTRAQ